MRFRAIFGPRLAILLVCLCALANARLVVRAWSEFGKPPRTEAADPFLERIEPLHRLLPEKTSLGFLVDTGDQRLDPGQPDKRFGLTQYALLPRRVETTLDHPLVIVDSGELPAEPAIAVRSGWRLMIDLDNGIRVYRTGEGR